MMVRYEFGVEGGESPRCTGAAEHAGVEARTFAPFSIRRRFPQRHEALLRAVEDESAASGKSSLFRRFRMVKTRSNGRRRIQTLKKAKITVPRAAFDR